MLAPRYLLTVLFRVLQYYYPLPSEGQRFHGLGRLRLFLSLFRFHILIFTLILTIRLSLVPYPESIPVFAVSLRAYQYYVIFLSSCFTILLLLKHSKYPVPCKTYSKQRLNYNAAFSIRLIIGSRTGLHGFTLCSRRTLGNFLPRTVSLIPRYQIMCENVLCICTEKVLQ